MAEILIVDFEWYFELNRSFRSLLVSIHNEIDLGSLRVLIKKFDLYM